MQPTASLISAKTNYNEYVARKVVSILKTNSPTAFPFISKISDIETRETPILTVELSEKYALQR